MIYKLTFDGHFGANEIDIYGRWTDKIMHNFINR